MFLSKLFGGNKSKFDVKLHLSPSSYVEEINNSKTLTDKDYILFALLIYARMLRLLSTAYKQIQIDSCKIFLEFSEGFKKPNRKNFNELDILIKTLANSSRQVQPLSIQMKKVSIFVGFLDTKDLDKYIYLAFSYAWNNIKNNNRQCLFDAFVELSNIRLSNQLSKMEAITVPNKIVSNLKLE